MAVNLAALPELHFANAATEGLEFLASQHGETRAGLEARVMEAERLEELEAV